MSHIFNCNVFLHIVNLLFFGLEQFHDMALRDNIFRDDKILYKK